MAEAFFLKKKTKPAGVRGRGPAGRGGATAGGPSTRGGAPGPSSARPPPRPKGKLLPRRPVGLVAKPPVPTSMPSGGDIMEFQIVSAGSDTRRFNIMKLNSSKDVDPATLPRPIMMNRKQSGPRQLPQFATDEEGKVIGRYVFDEEGKPVLDDEGKPTIEKKEGMDMSLVGTAPGTNNKRRGKRQTKEVFHQDIDVIKLRREEANPWVLEAKDKTPDDHPDAAHRMPEHWVGRMTEPSALPTVLLVNNGQEATFTMIPLGRSYKFEPERPFKVMDADQAHKYYEHQTKYKVHDRWGQRQEGSGAGPSVVKNEPHYLEDRAQRLEWNILANKGKLPAPTVKREKFEDDYVRENRNIGRGLEAGADEELDYDMNDDFQDDEDSNTFYVNNEEDEEKKLLEEKQKREYRLANYNVGDRPQLEGDEDEDEDDDDDLFAERLTSEGKKLRKQLRRRGADEGFYESTDDESSSDSEDEDKEKEKEKEKKPPGSAEKSRPASRAGSRPPDARSGSPSRRPGGHPTPERRGMPGAGQALLAKRAASRGVSPRPGGGSRAGSPLARGSSPDHNGRSGSPAMRGSSPATREGTPVERVKPGKRKATASPMDGAGVPAGSLKRKGSPADSPTPPSTSAASPAPTVPGQKKKKRKSSASATPDLESDNFPGMIDRDAVLQWLRAQPPTFPQLAAITHWKSALNSTPEEFKDRNTKRFLGIIKALTDRLPDKRLELKPQFRQ